MIQSTFSLLDRPAEGRPWCPFWCNGRFCAPDMSGDRFHCITVAQAPDESGETLGLDLVRNDFGDGTSTGTLIDLTWSQRPGALPHRSMQFSPAQFAATFLSTSP